MHSFGKYKKKYETDPFLKILIVFTLTFFMGAIAGNFQFFSRCKAFAQYGMQKEETSIVDILTSETTNLDYADEHWIRLQNPELMSDIEKLKVSNADLESERYLSKDDQNFIFFLGGPYTITDWDDTEEIKSKVLTFIEDKIALNRENTFDKPIEQGGANNSTKNLIAQISESESQLEWFYERLDNMEIRQDIYSLTPKSSLANLISNDEHFLALTLYINHGKTCSILYYYSKSIEYKFEQLSFKGISKDHIKSELEWISSRYSDIVYTCNDYTAITQYAEKLEKAYADIAKIF